MKGFYSTLAFGLGASAAVIKRAPTADCCFGINVSGFQSGSLGELYDGQIRVGPGYGNSTFCYNSAAGTITDQAGRGCVEIGAPKQYQCDEGKVPSGGITIDSAGVISHNGSSTWYECLVNDQGVYNIYTADTGLATKCQVVKLTTQGGNCAAASPSVATTTVMSTVAGPTMMSTVTAPAQVQTVSAPAQVQTVTAPAQVQTVTAPASACSPSTVTVNAPAPAAQTVTVTQAGSAAPAASTVTVTAPAPAAATVTVTAPAPAAATITVTSVQSCAVQTEIRSATATVVSTAVSVSNQVSVSTATVEKPTTAVVTSVVEKPTTAVVTSVSNQVSVSTATVQKPTTAVVTSVATSVSTASASAVVVSKTASTSAPVVVAPTTSSSAAPSTSTATSTSVVKITSTSTSSSASATATGPVCPNNLSGEYQYPHLIVPVNSAAPNKSYGTQYFAYISSVNSTIFNFDVPASYAGKTCDVIFTLPEKSLLETTDYTLKSAGSIAVSQLSTVATQATTYSSVGSSKAVKTIPVIVGTQQIIASGPCAAGTAISYEFTSVAGTDLSFFEDWNPCPLGVFMTVA